MLLRSGGRSWLIGAPRPRVTSVKRRGRRRRPRPPVRGRSGWRAPIAARTGCPRAGRGQTAYRRRSRRRVAPAARPGRSSRAAARACDRPLEPDDRTARQPHRRRRRPARTRRGSPIRELDAIAGPHLLRPSRRCRASVHGAAEASATRMRRSRAARSPPPPRGTGRRTARPEPRGATDGTSRGTDAPRPASTAGADGHPVFGATRVARPRRGALHPPRRERAAARRASAARRSGCRAPGRMRVVTVSALTMLCPGTAAARRRPASGTRRETPPGPASAAIRRP